MCQSRVIVFVESSVCCFLIDLFLVGHLHVCLHRYCFSCSSPSKCLDKLEPPWADGGQLSGVRSVASTSKIHTVTSAGAVSASAAWKKGCKVMKL